MPTNMGFRPAVCSWQYSSAWISACSKQHTDVLYRWLIGLSIPNWKKELLFHLLLSMLYGNFEINQLIYKILQHSLPYHPPNFQLCSSVMIILYPYCWNMYPMIKSSQNPSKCDTLMMYCWLYLDFIFFCEVSKCWTSTKFLSDFSAFSIFSHAFFFIWHWNIFILFLIPIHSTCFI